MNPESPTNQSLKVTLFSFVGLGLLAIIFYTPIWWVSLTAPNYPAESFPDGVRIQFHVNGVFNGCKKQDRIEIEEEEALDCVHEMDTINHYVGMYPIAAGGPVERGYGQFLVIFLGIMLIGFIISNSKIRMGVMSAGFVGLAIWMYLTMFSTDGFHLQNKGYIEGLVTSLDQDASDTSNTEPEFVIGGVTGVLKKSLEDSGVDIVLPSEIEREEAENSLTEGSTKELLIEHLRTTYDIDYAKSASDLSEWNGHSFQVMLWHYGKSLGRYFNNPAEIAPMVKTLDTILNSVFWLLLAAMILLVFGARKNSGILYWLLVLVPMALPLFFIIDYSAWLWWYGHTLNDMGAFSVKPFMPTVFGDGKVAQFTTHSYPDNGFFLMMLMSVVLALAALIRRKQLKSD